MIPCPGVATDGDDLWTTRGRSPRRWRAELAGKWAELILRWHVDPPRKRTSAEERRRRGRAEVSPTGDFR
jgi:hypothetical protein